MATVKPSFLTKQGLFKYKQDRRKYLIKKTDAVGIGLDAGIMLPIFVTTFTESLTHTFETSIKYYLLPIAFIINFMRTVLAWLEVRENNKKNGTVENAVVETAALIGLGVVVVGKLFFDIVFAHVAPIVFGLIMALKTFYNLLAGGYYLGKSVLETNPKLKESYRVRGTIQAAAGAASLVAGIAVVAVMMLLQKYLSFLGIAAGATGIGVGIYKWKKGIAPKANEYETLPEFQDFDNDEKPKPRRRRSANTIAMHRKLGVATKGDYQLVSTEKDDEVEQVDSSLKVESSFKDNRNNYYTRFDPERKLVGNRNRGKMKEKIYDPPRCNM